MPYLYFYRRGDKVIHTDLGRFIGPGRTYVLGSEQGDQVIPGDGIAPIQFEIALDGDALRLTDRSGHKTNVDDTAVDSVILRDGAVIVLGKYALIYYVQHPDGAPDTSRQTLAGAFVQPTLPKSLWVHARPRGGGEPVRCQLRTRVTIGASADSDLRLTGDGVSAHHAELTLDGNELLLRDLGSTNHTWVGVLNISATELPLGVRFRVDNWDIWVEGPALEIVPVVTAGGLVTADPRLFGVLQQVRAAGPSKCAVLITGETGSGKEKLAQAVHEASSRAGQPLVHYNCGLGRSKETFASDLFGYEKGSYTGANVANPGILRDADGGTVHLDEVGDLPLELQTALLRTLDNGEVHSLGLNRPVHTDVRIICSTHRDLAQAVREGRFREDLYYRLNVLVFRVPPLRQRPADIILLWNHFFEVSGREPRTLTQAALDKLLEYPWPGNVRQLHNVVTRIALDERLGQVIDADDIVLEEPLLPASTPGSAPAAAAEMLPHLVDPRGKSWEAVKAANLAVIMLAEKGGRRRACRQLGIDMKTLLKMLKEYGLEGVGVEVE